MALSDYDQNNQSGGQGPVAPQGNSGGGGRALSKRWSELTQKQKDRFGSKSEFSGAKTDYKSQQNVAANAGGGDAYTSTERSRMAGGKMKELNSQLSAAQEAGQDGRVEKLQGKIDRQESRVYGDGTGSIADNYDASAGGAGSGVNKARTSGKDLRELEQRYGKQAVVDYMDGAGKDTLGGNKAQNLLKQYKSELTESTVDPETPVEEVVEEIKDNDPTTTTPTPDTSPTPAPGATTPSPTQSPSNDDDSEQTPGTLTGGGIGNVGDNANAETGGVIGGVGNVGGNNQQEGTGNMVGTGSVNTGGNEMTNNAEFGNDSIDFGKNNTLNGVNIDQSERYYGGTQNNMSVVYGEGSNQSNTSAVSDLTMLGLGKADDSPAAQAQFVDQYTTMNRDNQKAYDNPNDASKYISRAAGTNPVDMVELNKSISQSIQNHYDRADIQRTHYMGDSYAYRPPVYNMPENQDPITSEAGEIAKDYAENLEDD